MMYLTDKLIEVIQLTGPTTSKMMTQRLKCGTPGAPTKVTVQKCLSNLAFRKKLTVVGSGRSKLYCLPNAVPEPISTPAPIPQPQPQPQAPALDLTALIDTMTTALAEQFAASLATKLTAVIKTQLAAAPAPAQSPCPSKPRITIVGLLPGQASLIDREFNDAVDLHFVTSEQSTSQKLKGLCRTSAAVLAMTGFISHTTEDVIKANGGNLIRVSGGMTSLRDAITEAFVGATA